MRLAACLALVLSIGVVAAACGGSDFSNQQGDSGSAGNGGGGEASNPERGITVDELPGKYAAAFCEVFTGCVGDLWGIYRPGEQCIKDFQPAVSEAFAPLSDAIDAGRVKYDGTKVQSCLDDITGRDCAALSERQPASCKVAMAGTVKRGEDCTLDQECEGDQYCKIGSSCPGTCAAYESAGGVCGSDDNCKSGLVCGDNGHCVTPAKGGEACDEGEPKCAAGFICLGQDAAAKKPGTCYAIAEALSGNEGDACSFDGHLCKGDLSCEITSIAPLGGKCVPKVAASAACHAALPDECPSDQYCVLGTNPLLPGTCQPKPKAGEKCAKGLGDSLLCAPYARCDDGVCREIAHAGEDCTQNDTCYSSHCVDGACVTGNSCQ